MIKTILTALTESLILESYKDVKTRFINDGADKDEVTKLLDLHKKLKDMNRLKKDEVNIDAFAKGKSFDEFKSLMSRYSEKDTETKTDKWNELKNKIVAENDEWTVYAIDTPEEAYLFHGLTKWCISSGTKEKAKEYFSEYNIKDTSEFFAIVRKNPVGDEFDYIMDQYNWKKYKHTYWDAEDHSYTNFKRDLSSLNIPSYKNEISKISTKIIAKHAKAKLDAKNAALNKLKLNDDGTYSYDWSLYKDMLNLFIENGKFTIKFKDVAGDFSCRECGLTSLEGVPHKVGGDFNCSYNKLTSLEGAPEEVGGNFVCNGNNLTSLEGAPKEVSGDFNCCYNKLTSLEDCPEKVSGDFNCSYNKLTSLEGCPKEVGGCFECWGNNNLKSLDGIGKVNGRIYSNF